jgi:hypothetical protein
MEHDNQRRIKREYTSDSFTSSSSENSQMDSYPESQDELQKAVEQYFNNTPYKHSIPFPKLTNKMCKADKDDLPIADQSTTDSEFTDSDGNIHYRSPSIPIVGERNYSIHPSVLENETGSTETEETVPQDVADLAGITGELRHNDYQQAFNIMLEQPINDLVNEIIHEQLTEGDNAQPFLHF